MEVQHIFGACLVPLWKSELAKELFPSFCKREDWLEKGDWGYLWPLGGAKRLYIVGVS